MKLIKIYNKILKQGNIAAYIDNQRVQKIVVDFNFFTFYFLEKFE